MSIDPVSDKLEFTVYGQCKFHVHSAVHAPVICSSFTGKFGKENSMKRKYKPFDMLKIDDLKKELKSRGLSAEGNKLYLEKEFQKEMKGLIRVPALCFTHPTKQLEDLNLEHYEIGTVEPMHDLAGNCHNSKI